MNKFVKILIAVVGVAMLAVGGVLYFTSGMVRVADEFFLAVKDKDMPRAYSYLAEDFKAGTSQSELAQFLAFSSLDDFKEANWGSRSVEGGRGNLVGSITSKSGGVFPITLDLVKADEGWKIYAIKKPVAGIQQETTSTQMPREIEQVRLVSDAMQVFAESVNARSMASFHGYVSNLWQRQFTVEMLDDAFGSFYDLDLDLSVLRDMSPIFEVAPTIGPDGVMVLSGSYATQPSRVHFEQKYIYEGTGWKLVGFSIDIQ